ncbi:RNA polymerase sigma factor [Aequorivita antarctica]|uniref:Sigma-70 family RNA polymerase sigma factor n=1 Tax=Aequorivita antarctica TaxID=153266 RepID=A0A5C6Z2R6_9FLAO|nr:sigma-70 family RNA polymerase sigma factor [Aequorivita antarctica]TXD73839.1 sigma-70 family RNA polymerase sigma factor [Aequorivita antarctica]SRX73445.1 ECF RNA polymerase sigma factor SigW [Aequorivita antarctica]
MKQNQSESLRLWAKLQDGNLEALGMLYDIYIDDLFTYGMGVSGNKSEVMDCIHDLFLNLYKYRKNLSNTDRVDFYLMRSLKNEILKRIQISKRKLTIGGQENNISFQISTEEGFIANEWEMERSQKLTKAIKSLSKKQRKGLSMRFSENYSYEEIAEQMNISVQSSRTMIYRAIKVLRSQLQYLILVYLIFFCFFKK